MFPFVVAALCNAQSPGSPITDLIAAYPYGEQLALEATPDNKRMFVAVGAAVSVVDLAGISGATLLPRVVDRIELPECSPMAMLYHRVPGQTRRLYVAGGTMGLWKVDLCRGLFDNFNPSPCVGASDPYARTQIDRPGNGSVWKRCVDVELLSGNAAAGSPLLLALFASRSDSVIGPTELRAYRLGWSAPDSIDSYFTLSVFPTPPGIPTSIVAVGTALAVDPADPNSVYVALGPAGICRVDLNGTQPVASAFPYFGCDAGACPYGEQVRDLSIVHTSTQGSALYAASEYGHVYEFRPLDPTGAVIPTPEELVVSEGFPMKVSAVVDGDQVTLAVGTAAGSGVAVDSRAPFRTTGRWFGRCAGPGTFDPNPNPPVPHSGYWTVFFSRDLSAVTPLASPVFVQPATESWNSLILRRIASDDYRVYECTSNGGTNIHSLSSGGGAAWSSALVGEFDDIAMAAGDIAVSELNNQLLMVGVDPILARVRHEGGMFYVQEQPQRDILPVLGTEGLCGVDARPEWDSWLDPCHPGTHLSFSDPNPYLGALLGCTHWVQGNVEYFLPGAKMFARFDSAHAPIPEPQWCNDDCTGNPPQPANNWVETSIACTDPNRVGWRLVGMQPAGASPSAASLAMHWWQLPCPTRFANAEVPALDYLHSERLGDLLFCTRSGSKYALKILQAPEMLAAATACVTGSGVRIPVDPGTDPSQNIFMEIPTHPEFGDPQSPSCVQRVDCDGTGSYVRAVRHVGTYRSHVFFVRDPVSGASKAVVAVAAGFVAAGPAPDQLAGCAWTSAAGRPLVTLLDATETVANFREPTRRQIALGALAPPPSGVPLLGSTWAVKTRTYAAGTAQEKTYAFLADLEGRLHVVDVSYDKLFGPGTGIANPIPSQCLTAEAVVELQPDPEPADGFGCNCTDVEVDGNFAYCALGRGGVGVVDITVPTQPQLSAIIDTPGVAVGVAIRIDAAGHHQLVVGDTRCGLRLYGKPGE